MGERPSRLGDVLLQQGRISAGDLADAIRYQKGAPGMLLGEILIKLEYVGQHDVAAALAEELGLPFVELDEKFRLTPEEVELIPEHLARKYGLVPMQRDDDSSVLIVMRDPLDIEAIDAVRLHTHIPIRKAVGVESEIAAVISRAYRADAFVEEDLHDLVELETSRDGEDADDPGASLGSITHHLHDAANDAPVVRFVNLVLMQAIRDRASDIHFEPEEHHVSVRLRVDGRLRDVTPPPKSLYPAVVTRLKILSNMDISERRIPADGRFKFTVDGRQIDVRVSSLPEIHGEKVVLRILDKTTLITDMAEMGFESGTVDAFHRVLAMPHGIMLLTGPTGSGKTTTLYSALNFLRSREKNIQTVEDPVEYQMEGINQMQVRANVGLTFASGLRSILRQDPDIILIGEIRDLETAQIAMRASMTGHFVLSSLHTNDAPSAFSRLRDIGVEPYLSAATVRAVVSQRLVRRICPHCTRPADPGDEAYRLIERYFDDCRSWSFQQGRGCDKCSATGYRGRMAIVEFLELSRLLAGMVQESASDKQLRLAAIKEGMEPLQQNGFRRIKAGLTTMDEVLSVCALTDYC